MVIQSLIYYSLTGFIGIELSPAWHIPLNPFNPGDATAADDQQQRNFGAFSDAIIKGDYSDDLKSYAGNNLVNFAADEKAMLRGK